MKQLWYRAVLIFAFSIAVVGGGYFLTALDDRMALRVQSGAVAVSYTHLVKGVYVDNGYNVKFKTVAIIYEGDTYYLSRLNYTGEAAVSYTHLAGSCAGGDPRYPDGSQYAGGGQQ